MKIAIEELKKLATTLKFEMSDFEYSTLQEEFTILLKQMNVVEKIANCDNLAPMTFPFIYETNGLRDDVVEEVLTTEEVLKNAKLVQEDQIKINKVVG